MKERILLIIAGVFILFMFSGCAGENIQLQVRDTAVPKSTGVGGGMKTVEFPKGTVFGGASKEQAVALARIFVESHNMAMKELADIKEANARSLENQEAIKKSTQRIEDAIQRLDDSSRKILEACRSNQEVAQKSLKLIEELAKKQGTGEITLFYPVGAAKLDKKSLEYERLVSFLDFLSREARGRKVLFISIGSASAIGSKKLNMKLAKERSETLKDHVNKYLVNIAHEFYKVYGTGDIYSPKKVKKKEHERYQHTRLIAVYETEQSPTLPEKPM